MNSSDEVVLHSKDDQLPFINVVILWIQPLTNRPQGYSMSHRSVEQKNSLNGWQGFVWIQPHIRSTRLRKLMVFDQVLKILSAHVNIAVLEDGKKVQNLVICQVLNTLLHKIDVNIRFSRDSGYVIRSIDVGEDLLCC